MDFSETIEVKAEDKDSSLPVDSYFFAYFRDLPDWTQWALCSPNFVPARAVHYPKGTSFRLSSLFRPFSDTNLLNHGATAAVDSNSDDYTYIQCKENLLFISITLSPKLTHTLFWQGTDSTSCSFFLQYTQTPLKGGATVSTLLFFIGFRRV